MAILQGINTKLRGSAGSWTFARVGGQTIAKEKVAKKGTPTRTYAQMVRRVQWANIINFYRTFDGRLHPSFQNRPSNVSDFNEFMSANIGVVSVYLTRDQSRQGGCVVAPYQVTRGSLPSITVDETMVGSSSVFVSNIALGTLTIDANTTIKAFSDAVIANNGDFANGDQITCFISRQTFNSENQTPYVKTDAYEVTLDQTDDTTKLLTVVTADGFTAHNGFLGMAQPVNGGVAYIHSRKEKGKTIVSTQRMAVSNTQLTTYQSENQMTAAIQSYGGTLSEEYLTPNTTDTLAPSNP